MAAEKSAWWLIFQGDTMRLDFESKGNRSESKSIVGIERTFRFEARRNKTQKNRP